MSNKPRLATAFALLFLAFVVVQGQDRFLEPINDLLNPVEDAKSWRMIPERLPKVDRCHRPGFHTLGGIIAGSNVNIESFERTYQLGPRSKGHVSLRINFQAVAYYGIEGCAKGDFFKVLVDGAEVYKACNFSSAGKANECHPNLGSGTGDEIREITFNVPHTAPNVTITFFVEVNGNVSHKAYGFRKLIITTIGCPSSCLTCSDKDNCQTCHNTAELAKDGERVVCRCAGRLATPLGENPLICEISCHESCRQCSKMNVCDRCGKNAFLDKQSAGNKCQCNNGTYANKTIPLECEACHATCASCKGGKENECLTCWPGASVKDGKCVCNDGFYKDPKNPKCQACSGYCKTCSDKDFCTSCESNAKLFPVSKTLQNCVCNDAFYANSTAPLKCAACDPSCVRCKGHGPNQCTACKPELELVNGSCIQCNAACKNCNGTKDSDCTICATNAVKIPKNGGYTCGCRQAYFASKTTPKLECSKCHDTCQTCETTDKCKTCPANGKLDANNRCECMSGFFAGKDSEGRLTCTACDPRCKECNGPSSSNCTACFPGFANVDKQCHKCHTTCATCKGKRADQCESCSAINSRLVTGPAGGECKCQPGFFSRTTDYLDCKAYKCDVSCAKDKCHGPDPIHCDACAEGYSRSTDGKTCQRIKCDPNCATCDFNATYCTSCAEGGKLVRATGTSICRCQPGLYKKSPDNQPLVCAQCPVSCKTCNGNGTGDCVTCHSTSSVLIPGSVAGQGQCKCMTGTYLAVEVPWTCNECHPTCQTCGGRSHTECLSCKSPLTLIKASAGDKGECIECHKSCLTCKGIGDRNCSTCKTDRNEVLTDGQCLCKAGTYSDSLPLNCQPYVCHSSCVKCKGPKPTHCTECKPEEELVQGACRQRTCHGTCKTCSGATDEECLSCVGGADLLSTGKGKTCKCNTAYFQSGVNPLACTKCDSTCKTCVGAGDRQCKTCFDNAQIVKLLSGSEACECKAGFYLASKDPFVCKPCDGSCTKCVGPRVDQCTECKQQTGAAAVPVKLVGGKCVPCDPICKDCKDAGPFKCTKCPDNADLISNTQNAADPEGTCKCKPKFWSDSTVKLDCRPYTCTENCDECIGPKKNHCTKCKEVNATGTTGGAQLQKFKLVDGQCLPFNCDSTCLDCSGPTDNDCTRCPTNAKIIKANSTSKCICVEGTFTEVAKPLRCTKCDPTCLTCDGSSSSGCTSCIQGALLANKRCNCPDGKFAKVTDNVFSCQSCHGSCATCSGPSEAQCSSCPAGKKLWQGSCITCHGSCADCEGTGPNDCLTCPKSAQRTNTTAKTSSCVCEAKTWSDTTNPLLCKPYVCDKSCKECRGPHRDLCTKCPDPVDEYRPIPPTGGACIKHSCHANCLTCYGPLETNCKTCTTGGKTVTKGDSTHCQCKDGFKATRNNPLECKELVCDPSCLTCATEEADGCTSCREFTTLSKQLSGGNKCICNAGYYSLINGREMRCLKCDVSCKECSDKGVDKCTACADGKKLVRGQCVTCDKICSDCSDVGANKCTLCPKNAELAPVDGGNTCRCSKGFFSRAVAPLNCQPYTCHPSCLAGQCNGPDDNMCTACPEEFKLINGKCVALQCHPTCTRCVTETDTGCRRCPPNADLMVVGKEVPPRGSCKCLENKFVASLTGKPLVCGDCDKTCRTCKGPGASDCLTCLSQNTNFKDGVCTCQPGFFLDPKNGVDCQPCHVKCATCSGAAATQCLTCPPDRKLMKGECIQCHPTCKDCNAEGVNHCTECDVNAELQKNSEGSVCVCKDKFFSRTTINQKLDCKPYTCHATCVECKGPDDNHCTKCREDSDLINGKCVPINCHKNCATCNGPKEDQCTSCTSGARLQRRDVNRQACACNPGYEQVATEPLRCDVIPCHGTCGTCRGRTPQDCVTCIVNAALVNVDDTGSPIPLGSPIRGKPQCVCKEGFYLSISNGYKCTECHESCKTCDNRNVDNCLSCFPDKVLRKGKCVICHPTCLDCDDTGENHCTKCVPNAVLTKGPLGAFCVCKPGYSGPGCKDYKCDPSCKTCTGPYKNQCTACLDSEFWKLLPSGECALLKCHQSCLTCNFSTEDACSRCKVGASLEIKDVKKDTGKCVCKPFYNLVTANGQWKCDPVCDKNCATCSAPGFGQCTSCTGNAMLVDFRNGSTICQCKPGYFNNATDGTVSCQPCDGTCVECNGPSKNQCTKCQEGQALINGACGCHQNCVTCNGPSESNCTSCGSLAVLQPLNGGKTCGCAPGWQQAPTIPLSCTQIPCHYTCKTCSQFDENRCLSCWTNATLTSTNTTVTYGHCDCYPPNVLWESPPVNVGFLCQVEYTAFNDQAVPETSM